jgi:manganese transport protein
MEGFLDIRLRPWLRRLITRSIAIVPAIVIIGIFGESKSTDLLVASQVCLSMQLGFACWPLMRFTSDRAKMGEFVNSRAVNLTGWAITLIIIALNIRLLWTIFF